MLDRLEIKNGAQDTNFQLCRLHIDLFHDDFSFWPGLDFMGGGASIQRCDDWPWLLLTKIVFGII